MTDIIACPRCGHLCKRSTPVNPDARLLIRTDSANGLCPNCAVTAFLMSVEPVKAGIEMNGVAKVLSNPLVREQFITVMRAGGADMKPEEINWQSVIDNWALPFPAAKRKKRNASPPPDRKRGSGGYVQSLAPVFRPTDAPVKRCGCGGGECSRCLLDEIDAALISVPNFRYCRCGSEHCAVCNYYAGLGLSPAA